MRSCDVHSRDVRSHDAVLGAVLHHFCDGTAQLMVQHGRIPFETCRKPCVSPRINRHSSGRPAFWRRAVDERLGAPQLCADSLSALAA